MDYACAAIERHQVVTATPAACRGLSRAEVSQAASTAIRMTETRGAKSVRRKQAGAAARWAQAMITGPAAAAGPAASAAPAGQPRPARRRAARPTRSASAASSESAAKAGALLAWLATAASGGLVLARWLLAGGSPLRRTVTAAPPAVILGHVGAGALGLVLWVSFMLSGGWPSHGPPWRSSPRWPASAWACSSSGCQARCGLTDTAPRHGPSARGHPAGGTRIPVLAIVGHGMFAVTTLLLVLMATIGAG